MPDTGSDTQLPNDYSEWQGHALVVTTVAQDQAGTPVEYSTVFTSVVENQLTNNLGAGIYCAEFDDKPAVEIKGTMRFVGCSGNNLSGNATPSMDCGMPLEQCL